MTHYLIVAIVDFVVAVVSLSKRNNTASKALAFVCICLGLWSLELYLLTVIKDKELLSVWFHITRAGMFMIPPSIALLTWMLLGRRSKFFLFSVVGPGFFAGLVIVVLNIFFFPSELETVPGGYMPKADFIFSSFVITFTYCLAGSVLAGIFGLRSSTFREKKRVKWLLIIILMTMSTGLASIFLVKYDFYLRLAGATTNITFVVLLFYATIQHHLMEFRLALSVGLARLAAISGVAFTYFFLSGLLRERLSEVSSSVIMVGFLAVALESYPRLLRYLVPNARKLLSGSSYEYTEIVKEAEATLSNAINFKQLNGVLDFLIKHIVGVSEYNVYLIRGDNYVSIKDLTGEDVLSFDGKKLAEYSKDFTGAVLADEIPDELRSVSSTLGAKAFFNMDFKGESMGLFILGEPRDAENYKYDDILFFEWLAKNMGNVVSRINMLDVMHEQLGQAKKTLSMLGVMNHYHHDIKAPLAIIDGVLSNDIYDREKQRDIVLQQVERGSQLIATMAGILKGERIRRVRELSLEQVVKDSLFLFSQGIDDIVYDFSPVPNIRGDAEDLKILIINLAKNAMEARRSSCSLDFLVKIWMKEKQVCLLVRDTGEGISSAQLDKIWDESYSSKTSGNGIGLQAIKRIADEHGAVIEVKSTVGVGTEFIFTFPESIICHSDIGKNLVGVPVRKKELKRN